jgi:hypothetical protein
MTNQRKKTRELVLVLAGLLVLCRQLLVLQLLER